MFQLGVSLTVETKLMIPIKELVLEEKINVNNDTKYMKSFQYTNKVNINVTPFSR